VVQANGSGKHVLALHSQVAIASGDTPVFERFYAGGYRSMRGFAFRGIGPDDNGFKTGGNFMLLNSLEYHIPITAGDKVSFVTFVDSALWNATSGSTITASRPVSASASRYPCSPSAHRLRLRLPDRERSA